MRREKEVAMKMEKINEMENKMIENSNKLASSVFINVGM